MTATRSPLPRTAEVESLNRDPLGSASAGRRAPQRVAVQRTKRLIRACVVLVRLLAALLFAIIPSSDTLAQVTNRSEARTAVNADWHFRHELFQMLLEERGLKIAESLDAALAAPRDSVIVILGKLGRDQANKAEQLLDVAERGGTVLIALDSNISMPGIANFSATAITSEDSATQYQQHSDCLRVDRLERTHPLMKGLSEIVVNRTGWLVLQPSKWMTWEVLAKVPESCSPRRSRGQPLIAASLSGLPDAGTMIVAADPSLFTNNMLWHGDNALFAIRLSELLCRGEKRRLVFVVDGRPLPSYRSSPLLQETAETPARPPTTVPTPPSNETPPKPTLETALRLANSVIQNVEESNILNEAMINQPRPLNRRLYAWILLVGLIGITAAWLTLKTEHTAAVTPPSPAVRTMKTAQTLNREDEARGVRYGAAAQALARDLCQELTAGTDANWRRCLATPERLPIWEQLKSSQRRDLGAIVKLAASSDTPHISTARLRQIGAIIQMMRALHRQTLLSTTSTANGTS